MLINSVKKYKQDKEFYTKLFIITLPIVLQSLITSSLNLLDTVMIGRIGDIELASVGIANQYYFVFSLLANAIAIGSGVLIAQLWGKKDIENIKRVLAKSLSYALTLTVVFVVLGFVAPKQIINIFSHDAKVINIGVEYLRIVVFSYLFTTISFTFASGLRSIGNTKLPMWASFIGLLINAILNAILIFGLLGFAPMGIRGAALATLIARVIECFIITTAVYTKIDILKVKLEDFKKLSNSLSTTLYKVTLPIFINEACWAFGNITYTAIYASIGIEAMASIQICTTIMNLFMIVTFGLANGSVVIIGNEIGASNEEGAIETAKKISNLSVKISILLALIIILSAHSMVSFFNVSETVKLSSEYILYFYGIVMVFKVYNAVMIVGILRGGGDATYGSILQAITLWLVGIPLAYFAANILRLPVHLVVGFTIIEEILKFFIMRRRFKSFKWLRNMVKEEVLLAN